MAAEYFQINGFTRYLLALGLREDAGFEECHAAYLNLLKRWHPDRFPEGHPDRHTAERKSREITDAFERIKKAKLLGTNSTVEPSRVEISNLGAKVEKLDRLTVKVSRLYTER